MRILKTVKKKLLGKKYICSGAGTAVLLALLLMALLIGREPAVYSFAVLSGLETAEVQRLAIQDSVTREQLLVEDREEITALLDLLALLSFEKERDGAAAPGWTHTVDLYRNGESYLRLIFAGKAAVLSFYTQGRQERETRYAISNDITPQLQIYFEQLLAARQKKEEEASHPVTVTVREIIPAICVVINNYPAARPSSGLQQADIIYEFLAEGGTTRYLAVYKRMHLENFVIGPVRSLRPYLAIQSVEYGGIIAHSGYSPHTMQMISGLDLFQIGDVGDNFWRDRARQAPHNLYTSIDNLYRASLRRIQSAVRTYTLPQEVMAGYQEGEAVEIKYAAHNRVSYRYDAAQGVYNRYINNAPHTDRETGKQYFAHRVIIRRTPHRNLPGAEGLLEIDLQGSGEGLLYEQGRKYFITWKNSGKETTYYFGDNLPIGPIPGSTWIQIVP